MATVSFERKITIRNKKGIKALKVAINSNETKCLKTTKDITTSSERAKNLVKSYFEI